MKYVILSKTKARGRDGEKFYQVRLAPLRDNTAGSRQVAELSITDTSLDSIFANKDTDDEIEIS